MPPLLALTLGEPAGIGPDLAIAVWLRRVELDLPPFYVIADRAFLTQRAKLLGTPIPLALCDPGKRPGSGGRHCPWSIPVAPRPQSRDIRTAAARRPRLHRLILAFATCWPAQPVPSSPIRSPRTCSTVRVSGTRAYRIFGQTCSRSHRCTGARRDDAVGAGARRGAGDHPPAAGASAAARSPADLIVETGRIIGARSRRRGSASPIPGSPWPGSILMPARTARWAPRTITIVAPAVAQLKAHGIAARGPLPADTMFHADARADL